MLSAASLLSRRRSNKFWINRTDCNRLLGYTNRDERMHDVEKVAINCSDIIYITKYIIPIITTNSMTKLIYIRFTQIKTKSLRRGNVL